MSESSNKINPFENIGEGATDLSDFRPKLITDSANPEDRAREKAAVTDLAVESGFKINNFEEKPIKAERRPNTGPTILKTLRLHVSDYNRFRRWCNKNGHSSAAGFKILVEGLPKIRS